MKQTDQNKLEDNQIKSTEGLIGKYISTQIRHHREVSGMSQKILAQKLGISPQQIQKYETSENRVSAQFLFLISDLLLVDIRDFFPTQQTRRMVSDAVKNTDENEDIEDIRELIKMLSTASKEDRKRLIMIAKTIFDIK